MKRLGKFIYISILIFSLMLSLLQGTSIATNLDFAGESVNDSGIITRDTLDTALYSNCLILVEKNTGDVLYEKNSHVRLYPASTAKILTAILVLENCDLNEIATVSQSAIDAVPNSYTTAHLKQGEQFSVSDLLHAMLIPSANDAANVLAEHVSSSIEEFANLMNEKASSLGLTDSHFTNPSRHPRCEFIYNSI